MPTDPYSSPRPVWKRFLIGALVIVGLMTGATASIALLEVKHIESYFPHNTLGNQASLQITPAQAGSPETILVIGSDKRAHSSVALDRLSPPHSDTLMLIRMDPNQAQTSVLSIPRDLKVTITPLNGLPSVQKINAAYSIGGAALTAATIKHTLPGIDINHIVDVNFFGFRHVIDAIGCAYVFVDRLYFNPPNDGFASIDIHPGYQKLCGQTALDYVRYRHTDSDFVRVARQQDFIRQAKAQISALGLFNNQDALLRSVQQSVQTDIHGSDVAHLLELALFSLGRPLRQVPFDATPGPSFVTANPYQVQQTVYNFLHGKSPAKVNAPHVSAPRRRRNHAHGAGVPGLASTPAVDLSAATGAAVGLPLKLYVPRLQLLATPTPDVVRPYPLRDNAGHLRHAYAISIAAGLVGEYYGVEGTDWTNPPILEGASQTITAGGRTYTIVLQGQHFHIVAWHTPTAVYWINNSLLDTLSNAQMMAIAESARPVG